MPSYKKDSDKLVLPSSRDLLHNTLMEKLRLNRYDTRFMANIYTKYLSLKKPLSQGQNELYEKIIHKYRKQLRKLGVQYRDILELKWENGVVDLDTLTGQTYFRLERNENNKVDMRMYFNFNKGHIDEVRALIHDDEANHLNRGTGDYNGNFGNGQRYEFTWDNSNKVWYGPFNTYLFKTLYDFALRTKIKMDDSVQALYDAMEARGNKEAWTPSIRIINDRIYVSHIAETMLPILETIDPTDLSIQNIERLTRLGLASPPKVEHIAQYVDSVSPNNKHVILTEEDISELKDYLLESGRKAIVYSPRAWGLSSSKQTAILTGDDIEKWSTELVKFNNEEDHADSIDYLKSKGYNTLISTTPITSLYRSQDMIGKFAMEADKVIYIAIEGKRDNSNDTN